jgi:hypothetical protein
MHFMAVQTSYVEKVPGDPWTLVTSDQPVRFAISKWSQGNVQTGWIGEGFSKFAVLVSEQHWRGLDNRASYVIKGLR